MEERSIITSCFLPGTDARDSYRRFFEWVDKVYREAGLPCTSRVKGLKRRNNIYGCYHHLSGEESGDFLRLLQEKMMQWAAVCTQRDESCGSVVVTATSDKGQLTMTPQLVGPFQDK